MHRTNTRPVRSARHGVVERIETALAEGGCDCVRAEVERRDHEAEQLASFRAALLRTLDVERRPPTHEELRVSAGAREQPHVEVRCARCIDVERAPLVDESRWLLSDGIADDDPIVRALRDLRVTFGDGACLALALGVRSFDPFPSWKPTELAAMKARCSDDLAKLRDVRRGADLSSLEMLDALIDTYASRVAMLTAVVDGSKSARRSVDPLAPRDHKASAGLVLRDRRYPREAELLISEARRRHWVPIQHVLHARRWKWREIAGLLVSSGWRVPLAPRLREQHRSEDALRALGDRLKVMKDRAR
ncbi:MAG: hypothetical protein SFX73_31880 [Kofleriaceae bacterium]|nr:hypothetical protein [Kofleriaceae bacterium]